MMKLLIKTLTMIVLLGTIAVSCRTGEKKVAESDDFVYLADKFADLQVLKFKLPAFDELTLQQKEFIYYLSEAALSGRDIMWDQNFKYNLKIRRTIEAVIESYRGDRGSEEFGRFMIWAKRVFFSNGIHHHYSNDKFNPGFDAEYFAELVNGSDSGLLPDSYADATELLDELTPVIFDPDLYARKIVFTDGADVVAESSVNFYEGVTQAEVEAYYSALTDPDDPTPVSVGLNSRLVKKDGEIVEQVYHSGSLYGEAIDRIIYWLEKAAEVAETELQKEEIGVLIDYYRTGSLETWDSYNVIWAGNNEPVVDYVNGFIEVYNDPLGMKATWEAVVNYKDIEATRRTKIISENAQWFEDRSPIDPQYRKEEVKGVEGKVINVAMLGGDCYPTSPIGINLPNADWIRKDVGSKSVTLANITHAGEMASQGSGFLEEFAASEEEIARARKYGPAAGNLHTDFHEILGHGSGKLAEGTDPNALKNYSSPLEEMRADLFALYYMPDHQVIELGLLDSPDAAKATYDSYMRNGLMTQLVRISKGKDIEQAHMRCRAAITARVYEAGQEENVVEMFSREGKTYVRINDYDRLRELFGDLLRELQRIKSEGDFEAGKRMIEDYGIKIDPVLHEELLERYEKLDLAPYSGYMNPELVAVTDDAGNIIDVEVKYIDDFTGQMMKYGREYSFLK
ncbi:MAG: dihydrofolate reductase [Bacteroidales bacterium]